MAGDDDGKREKLQIHEPAEGTTPDEHCAEKGGQPPSKSRSAWTSRIALILAVLALVLALQQRFSTQKDAVISINQSMSNTVLPEMKKLKERSLAGEVYDLKHIMVTLDEIKENTTNEEVKRLTDRIQNDVRELGVKLLVYE